MPRDDTTETSSDLQDDETVNLRCVDCSNTVSESPVMMDRCIECGGDLEIVDGPVEKPTAPMQLPKYLREGVEKQSPDRLHQLAEYAEAMADWMDADAEQRMQERVGGQAASEPAGMLEKATDVDEVWSEDVEEAVSEAVATARTNDWTGKGWLVKKTIDDREYWYLNYRIKGKENPTSKYVAPVSPASE